MDTREKYVLHYMKASYLPLPLTVRPSQPNTGLYFMLAKSNDGIGYGRPIPTDTTVQISRSSRHRVISDGRASPLRVITPRAFLRWAGVVLLTVGFRRDGAFALCVPNCIGQVR